MTKGDKIKFIGCTDAQIKCGANDDPRFFPALVLGEIYTVKKVEVHSWHTKVWLEETGGKFNSVCFEEVSQ